MSLSPKKASGGPMEADTAWSQADFLLGEFSALLTQLGPGGLCGPHVLLESATRSASALSAHLQDYTLQVLAPIELPIIARAYCHARQHEVRELIALDQNLTLGEAWAPLAAASRKTGRLQLERLRPLRDERVLQRYLTAVESAQAQGWHTVVFGLTLAIYSLPLRQGLLHYGQKTLTGLVRGMGENSLARRTLIKDLCSPLPALVEQTLAEMAPNDAMRAAH